MTSETKVIKVAPESELARRLKEAAAARETLVVDTGEERFALSVDLLGSAAEALSKEQIERSREGIRKAAGAWKDVDTEAFKAYIAERRRTANRPSVRL